MITHLWKSLSCIYLLNCFNFFLKAPTKNIIVLFSFCEWLIYEFCFLVELAKGYPLPALGKMRLVNTQLQVLKVRDGIIFQEKLHVFKQAALIMWPGFLMRVNNWVENVLKTQSINKSQRLKAVTNRCCCAVFLSRITCWLGQMFSSRAEWRFWKCLRVISTITAVTYEEKLICKYYLSLKLEK